jgi:hypothetical protein
MAKIAIEFDTVEKTMTATVNGAALDNVIGAHLNRGYGKKSEYQCEVVMAEESEDDDMYKWTRIVATDSPEGQRQEAAGSKPAKVPGFTMVEDAAKKAKTEMLEFFGE